MKGRVTKTGYLDNSPDRFNDYNVIPSQRITMKGVSQPIMMFPIKNNKVSNPVQGIPGEEYYFPGADGVVEMPLPPGRMSYERKAKGGSTESKMRDVLSKVAYGKGGSTMTPELAAKILKTGSIYGKTLSSSQKNKFADLAAQIGIDENGDPIEEGKDTSSDVEEYKRGGSSPKTKKKSSKTTSKNVYTAINELFARNTMLYGSGGKEFYQPQMKQGGWLDQYQKGGTEENPVELPEVKTTPWTGAILNYEDANPKERYINDLKQAYLNNANTQGLNKLAGLSMENFPSNVEQQYANEYLYKRNNNIAPKIIDSYSKSGNRTEWVDKLTDEEKDIIKNSDYRFLLEPNAFDTSYAGAAKLLNAIGMPIEEGDAKSLGITKKEDKNIGKLNLLDFLNVPGQALGSALRSPNLPGNPNNAYMNNSMMKGLQGYHDPQRLAGEEILANPLNWTMAYDAPALGYGIGKGIKSLANFSDAFAPNLSGIGDDLLGRSRVDSPMPGIKSQLAKAPTSVGTSNYLSPIPEELYIDPNAQTFGSYTKTSPQDLPPPPPIDPYGYDYDQLNQDIIDMLTGSSQDLTMSNSSTPSMIKTIKGNIKGGLTKTGTKLKQGLTVADDIIKRSYDKTKKIITDPVAAIDPYSAGSLKNKSVLEQTSTAQHSLSDIDKAFLGIANPKSSLNPVDRIMAKDRFNENISDNAYKYWGNKIFDGLNLVASPKEIRAAHREAAELFKNYPIQGYAGKDYNHLTGLYIRNKFADRIYEFNIPRVNNAEGHFLPISEEENIHLLKEHVVPAKNLAEAVRRRLGKEPKFLSAQEFQEGLSSGKIKAKSEYYDPTFDNRADYNKEVDEQLYKMINNPYNAQEANTVSAYSKGYDNAMNTVLREQEGDIGRALVDPEYAKTLEENIKANMNLPESKAFYLQEAEKLNKIIQKNKVDSDLFSHLRRGDRDFEVDLVDPETLTLTGEKKLKSELKEGEAFLDRDFSSSTVSAGADHPAGELPFTNFGVPEASEIIQVPKGKKLSGAIPNFSSFSKYKNEREIILPKNLIRRVIKINEPKGHNGFYNSNQSKFLTEILNPYKKGGSTKWLDSYDGGGPKKDRRQIPQSGMVIDKRTNEAYYFGDKGETGSFPVLTGLNPELNSNTYSPTFLHQNPQYKNTPVGYYMMEEPLPKSPYYNMIYSGRVRPLRPIQAFGKSAPESEDISIHSTFNHPTDPSAYKIRNKLYSAPGNKRYISQGCINCQKESFDAFTNAVPKDDTLLILDSKNPLDLELLKQAQARMKKKPSTKKHGGWLDDYK